MLTWYISHFRPVVVVVVVVEVHKPLSASVGCSEYTEKKDQKRRLLYVFVECLVHSSSSTSSDGTFKFGLAIVRKHPYLTVLPAAGNTVVQPHKHPVTLALRLAWSEFALRRTPQSEELLASG